MRYGHREYLALACLALSLPLASAGFAVVASADDCADQGIKEIKSEIKYGPMHEWRVGGRAENLGRGSATVHVESGGEGELRQ